MDYNLQELITEEPPYTKHKVSPKDLIFLRKLRLNELKVEVYCPSCDGERIFTSEEETSKKVKETFITEGTQQNDYSPTKEERFENFVDVHQSFVRQFYCPMEHLMSILFQIIFDNYKTFLIKCGQYPSLSDLNKQKEEKYSKIIKDLLGEEKVEEYYKVHILKSQEYSIGALVYLRRIFESLLLSIFMENKEHIEGFDDKQDFINLLKSRGMNETISALENFLPKLVIETKGTYYSLLSKGIHELDKNECNKILPVLKNMTELILEKVHKEKMLEEKENETKEALNKIHSKTQNKNS